MTWKKIIWNFPDLQEVANDGESGLEMALGNDYNLLILDLMLPGVDGFEICRQVRDKKNTPIIMVSAKRDDIERSGDWDSELTII